MNQALALAREWDLESDERLYADPYDFDFLDEDLAALNGNRVIDLESSDWKALEFEHDMLVYLD